MGYSAWSCKESDMTEQLTLSLSFHIVLGIINNLEMRICLDFMQILCYFIYGTWASADFGV